MHLINVNFYIDCCCFSIKHKIYIFQIVILLFNIIVLFITNIFVFVSNFCCNDKITFFQTLHMIYNMFRSSFGVKCRFVVAVIFLALDVHVQIQFHQNNSNKLSFQQRTYLQKNNVLHNSNCYDRMRMNNCVENQH